MPCFSMNILVSMSNIFNLLVFWGEWSVRFIRGRSYGFVWEANKQHTQRQSNGD